MLTYKQEDIIFAEEEIVVNAANGIGWMGGMIGKTYRFSGIAESIHYATKGEVEKEIRRNYKIRRPGEVFFTEGHGVGRIGIIHAVTMLLPG